MMDGQCRIRGVDFLGESFQNYVKLLKISMVNSKIAPTFVV